MLQEDITHGKIEMMHIYHVVAIITQTIFIIMLDIMRFM